MSKLKELMPDTVLNLDSYGGSISWSSAVCSVAAMMFISYLWSQKPWERNEWVWEPGEWYCRRWRREKRECWNWKLWAWGEEDSGGSGKTGERCKGEVII